MSTLGENMETIFTRNNRRMLSHEAKRTDLVKLAITLDNYTMMNAQYAKQVFSQKKIAEVISNLCTRILVENSTTRWFTSHNGSSFGFN